MMSRQLPFVAGLVLAWACAHSDGRGDDKKDAPKPPDSATGTVADEKLATKAPSAGVIVTKKGWDELLKTWEIKAPFGVDFDKQLVIVATNQGSGLTLTTELDEKGNLAVRGVATADLRPGFRYALKRVDRAGIKTISGKPVPKE